MVDVGLGGADCMPKIPRSFASFNHTSGILIYRVDESEPDGVMDGWMALSGSFRWTSHERIVTLDHMKAVKASQRVPHCGLASLSSFVSLPSSGPKKIINSLMHFQMV